MRKTELDRLKRNLTGQLSVLLGHGEELVHKMTVAPPGDQPDPGDRALIETVRGQELRLRDRDRKLITKIQDALDRIASGTFGLCETCGAKIPPARLKARPVTTLCLECKVDAEGRERE